MYPMKDTIQTFEICISQYQTHSLFKFFKNIFEEKIF